MEIGDYVRTKKRGFQPPQIARITNMSKDSGYKNEYYIALDRNLIPYYEYHIYEEDVYKSSPNLIDLIEVGDYVNGFKVLDIVENDIYVSDYYAESYIGVVKAKDIKSIVTREMFESMEYKVGE